MIARTQLLIGDLLVAADYELDGDWGTLDGLRVAVEGNACFDWRGSGYRDESI